jgi:asparagine synthase (glutamine-hydrolysing)
MSGIVGLISLTGQPVDPILLGRMTQSMTLRGPDALGTWTEGHVGFGHTLLRVTEDSVAEAQPTHLDKRLWITSDARLDGRRELIRELGLGRSTAPEKTTDSELILQAYNTWGQECIQHLFGDFAFAIWDVRRRRLFAARDHFGVKPFYYACLRDCLVFSNTLDCVKLHPSVSSELNDAAIGDFLLFDYNLDPCTTAFAQIQRLPPAHSLAFAEGKLNVNRYWKLPIRDLIRYKRAQDYVEHFQELITTAVEDRLRTDHAAIFMSGGLDSTTVAAAARGMLSKQTTSVNLRAYAVVHDRLLPDDERYYSGLAGKALNIPIEYLPVDDYRLYERWGEPEVFQPEPKHAPLGVIGQDLYRRAAVENRVALTGYGGDPLLYSSAAYLATLLKQLRFDHIARSMVRLLLSNRRMPKMGFRTVFGLKRDLPSASGYPVWINEGFARQLNLVQRWTEQNETPMPIHPIRSESYECLTHPSWTSNFETQDPGVTGVPIEVRYPLFDLRVIDYVLALPPIPWCIDKELLRTASRGVLPEPVRTRPKTVVAGSPHMVRLRQFDPEWHRIFTPQRELTKYIDIGKLPRTLVGTAQSDLWTNLRPFSLNLWLRHRL